MSYFKISLAASTALTLSLTAAFADNNSTSLSQIGLGNDALITQSGNDNAAGSDTTVSSTYGVAENSILQEGDNNNLNIVQSGDSNLLGAQKNWSGTVVEANNFMQIGDNNDLEATQSGDGNAFQNFSQTANSPTTTDTNKVKVEQSGDNNLIAATNTGSKQVYTGSGDANEIDILQSGNDNAVRRMEQTGNGNELNIRMSGERNNINYAYQFAKSGESVANNYALVIMSGNDNGHGALTDDFSGAPGALASRIGQRGLDNRITLDFAGDMNDYGTVQNGERNRATGIVITGDQNSLGVNQYGSDNRIALSTVAGDGNSIGFRQIGSNNEAAADIVGNLNRSLIEQVGSDNDSGLWVVGDRNTAKLMVGINSDSNYLRGQQRYGNDNTMTVNVTGDNNNNSGSFFTDAALSARNDANAVTGLTFGRGDLWQHGSDNELTLNINGDNNLFAALQQGSNNAIVGSMSGGHSNQAVVAQLGNSNMASFSQVGSFNNIGITQ
ncbi:hypothetical protein [Sulfitobacter sp. 915]|uniref:hypothetical protein n=1 Tax=Sulfitobacter sp. 915 TaxID=3368558 RepID=UPI0037461620